MRNFVLTLAFAVSSLGLSAQHDYPLAQHLSTYFLGAQRCGNTQSWIHPDEGCHTQDGAQVSKDLTGGWHDCGDYIKFHVTGPYTALTYLYGYYSFPEAYPDNYSQAFSAPPANGIPDVLDEVKIETDYLIKCVAGSTIYWQIGAGEDHNSFAEPVTHGKEKLYVNGTTSVRTVYSTTSGKSNALGDAAAALALMSVVYRPYSATYADSCLAAAVSYYTVARISPAGTGDANANDGFYSWMSSNDYKDNLGFAAAMLHRATGTASYLSDAESYASSLLSNLDFSYSRMNHLLFLELYKITKTSSYLDKVASRVNGYTVTSCGYYHRTNWGSLRDAGCAAFLAALYSQQSGDTSAYAFAKENVDFILGSHSAFNNVPANFSFLIGYNVLGGGEPLYPHHAAAFGQKTNVWTVYNNENASPGTVPFKYKLSGGLAGGPETSCGAFNKNIDNYISNEFCSYYNAGFTGAVAYVNKIENEIVQQVQQQVDNVSIEVYPNPVMGELQIKMQSDQRAEFIIVNMLGQEQYRGVHTPAQNLVRIDVSHLNAGLYFIKGNHVTEKFVKF